MEQWNLLKMFYFAQLSGNNLCQDLLYTVINHTKIPLCIGLFQKKSPLPPTDDIPENLTEGGVQGAWKSRRERGRNLKSTSSGVNFERSMFR